MRSFRFFAGEEVAEELERATALLQESRIEHGQTLPKDLFIILDGPPPNQVIDFDDLATERDLFGAEAEGELELFPR